MGGLWGELGKKLADRWLSLLVLPGVLYLATAAAAHTLGQRHALDAAMLVQEVTTVAKQPAVTGVGGQIVLVGAILIASAAAGLVAEAAGALVERLVLAVGWKAWPLGLPVLADWWVRRKQHRWDDAHSVYHEQQRLTLAPDPADRPDPAVGRALVSGYESALPLTAEEHAALPVLAQGACLRFALTRAWDWLNTPVDALVTRKDPLAYVRRLDWYRAHPEAFA